MTDCYEILDKAIYEFTQEYMKNHSIESLLNELIEDEPSLTGNIVGIYVEGGFKDCIIDEAEKQGYEIEMDDQEVIGYNKPITEEEKEQTYKELSEMVDIIYNAKNEQEAIEKLKKFGIVAYRM